MEGSTLPATLQGFVAWLGSSAGLIVAASFILERLKAFQSLSSNARRWIVVVFVVLAPTLSMLAVRTIPADVWAALEPFYATLLTSLTVLATLFASQAAHAVDKALQARGTLKAVTGKR